MNLKVCTICQNSCWRELDNKFIGFIDPFRLYIIKKEEDWEWSIYFTYEERLLCKIEEDLCKTIKEAKHKCFNYLVGIADIINNKCRAGMVCNI